MHKREFWETSGQCAYQGNAFSVLISVCLDFAMAAVWFCFLNYNLCLTNFHIFLIVLVPCETLRSTTNIIVNLTSTVMGSNATYQCRDGSSDVYITQCTSDGVWEPNPNSTLDCTPPGIMLAS